MKTTRLLIALFFYSLFAVTGYAKPNEPNHESLDQIVAIVNQEVVTQSELNHSVAIVKMQMTQAHLPMLKDDVLQKQVLDQLINRKLQLQLAKQAGITITDQDLDSAIQTVAKQNQLSVNALYERLAKEGISSADYRNEMHDQLTLQKLQQQEIGGPFSVTPDEITQFMRTTTLQDTGPKEYQLDDIVHFLSDTPSADEIATAKKHAQNAYALLKQGKPFADVAKFESSKHHIVKENDLGFRQLSEIPSAFIEPLQHLQQGDIADPIEAPNGFHIIRLTALRKAGSQQTAPTRQQIEDVLLQRKFEEAVQNWVSKLRAQAFIVINPTK